MPEVSPPMSVAVLNPVGPWNEDDPMRHQHVSRRLANLLDDGAVAADLWVYEAVNVRLTTGRIFIPDLVVTPAEDVMTIEAAEVVLIGEVVSPGNADTIAC